MANSRNIDWASSATILVTFILFGAAILVKGWTHDLLLEAAVFLVSVKLILMSYKLAMAGKEMRDRLDRIEGILTKQP
jgi:hypothetical protein